MRFDSFRGYAEERKGRAKLQGLVWLRGILSRIGRIVWNALNGFECGPVLDQA